MFKRPVLRLLILGLLFVLVLGACADRAPQAHPSETPTAADQADILPSASQPATSPTADPTPTPAGLGEGSPWPGFLRALNFGVAAGNSYGPRSLAVHPDLGRAYIRTHARPPYDDSVGLVTVLDLASGEVLAVVETGLDRYAEGELQLDTHHGRLYAVNADETMCTVLDTESFETVATLDGVERVALNTEAGRLYIAGLGGLRILDAQDDALIMEVPVTDASRFLALAVDAPGERIYALYESGGDRILSLHDAGTLELQSSRTLPGRPYSLVADARLHRAYLTLDDGEDNLLWVVDSDGEVLEERRLGSWTQHTTLTLDADQGYLFLGREDYRNNGVTLLDTATLQAGANIPLVYAPNALAWDPASRQLVASQTYADQITILDMNEAEIQAAYPTAVNLVDVAVDPQLGTLYVTDTAASLHVLDSHAEAELAVLPGEGHIAVDSAHGRLYVGGDGAEQVCLFAATGEIDPPLRQTGAIHTQAKPVADAYHGSLYLVDNGLYLADLETLTVTTAISGTLAEEGGFSPSPRAVDAVVDPGTGRIFAIVNNGVPGSNNGNYLYVYEPDGYQRILADTERSVAYVDLDPNTGRAYVSRLYMNQRATSLLVDGQEYTARLDSLSGPLRVDPALGRLYLSVDGDPQGYLLVLDAGTLDILGAVPTPSGLTLKALDPERHLLYLDAGEGQLQVWSASGGQLPGPAEPAPATLPIEQVEQLFVGPGGDTLFAGRLYRSDDKGRSWLQIGSGLPGLGMAEVVISPEFTRDQTLFVVTAATDLGLGIWKSADGGRTWHMANAGLSDMAVSDLSISPAYGQDRTLFATTRRQGLFRSTDGGQSWLRLTERYYQPEGHFEPPGDVVLSPTYDRDQTLFVAHDGLHRSVDGGDSWEQVFAEETVSLALSPNLAAGGQVYGWFGATGLLRSVDRGATWQPASDGLTLQGYGHGRVLTPQEGRDADAVYLVWMPGGPDVPAQYFRSQDGGVTWHSLAEDVGQILTPVQLDPEGRAFLALDTDGRLARWAIDDLNWQPVSLPPVSDLEFHSLAPSPAFDQDRILYAVTEGSDILHSPDAGLTWEGTRFPLRVISGGPPELVLLPPDILLVGTELGLYRWQTNRPWHLIDGLPQGMAITNPIVADDGSLVVLAGAGRPGLKVYLSTDGGESWTQPLPELPYPANLDDLYTSPAFASDHTAFLAGSRRPLRSVGGSQWEVFGPPDGWNLSAFDLSPVFDRDGLLFMRLHNNQLWRSADGGETWTEVSGGWGEAPMGLVRGSGYRLPAITFSPDYGQDGVLLSRAGDALYRSTDGGATWTSVLRMGSLPATAVFSPAYGRDGTIYLLQGQNLYRSTDRGADWQALPPAPWPGSDEVQLELSPTFAQDATAVAWTMSGQLYRSSDGGQTWNGISTGLVSPGIRQVLFAPDYAESRLLFVVPYGGGIRKQVEDGPLVPVTEQATAPTPTTAPAPTPVGPACPGEPSPFQAVLDQAGHRLGCPLGPATQVQMAAQPFEQGHMIWDSSTRQIYVLYDSGQWESYTDTFVEGIHPAYDPDLPPPPRQPQRGFGKVWCEQLGGPEAAIGWALENERAVDGWRQPFEKGLLLWTDAPAAEPGKPGLAHLLADDGTWRGAPAPAPQ